MIKPYIFICSYLIGSRGGRGGPKLNGCKFPLAEKSKNQTYYASLVKLGLAGEP